MNHDQEVRTSLAAIGAPLGSPRKKAPPPDLEEALANALVLSHRDPTVARVLPLVIWRQRDRLDLDRLVAQASLRDERSAWASFWSWPGSWEMTLRQCVAVTCCLLASLQ
jgi:hypothetical protein